MSLTTKRQQIDTIVDFILSKNSRNYSENEELSISKWSYYMAILNFFFGSYHRVRDTKNPITPPLIILDYYLPGHKQYKSPLNAWKSSVKKNSGSNPLDSLNFGLVDFILICFLYKIGFMGRLSSQTRSVARAHFR